MGTANECCGKDAKVITRPPSKKNGKGIQK